MKFLNLFVLVAGATWILTAIHYGTMPILRALGGTVVLLLVFAAISNADDRVIRKQPNTNMVEYCSAILEHTNEVLPLAYALQAQDFYETVIGFDFEIKSMYTAAIVELVNNKDFTEDDVRIGADECVEVYLELK